MSPKQLRGFHPFAGLDPQVLAWVAGRSSILCVPEKRCLVRPGRSLRGYFYLLRGRLRLTLPGGGFRVATGQVPDAAWPVYPGPDAVVTLCQVQLLRVDVATEDLQAATQERGKREPNPALLPELQSTDQCWQHRFVSSDLLQRFSPFAWQRLLRAMVASSFGVGEFVVREGRPGDLCFVLRTGRAEVRGNGRVLAGLAPGDFFGEEALITGLARNASVVMTERGSVMSLTAEAFRTLLLAEVVRVVDEQGCRTLLHIGADPRRGSEPLPLQQLRACARTLNPARSYAVTGGTSVQRALAVFVLAQQGIDAVALAG